MLSSVLSDFARTLITDFPIQGILDHLVTRILDILPVTGAGVTLISPGSAPRYVAASDDFALAFEQLQSDTGEGPCLSAYVTGRAVSVPDLAAVNNYPVFGPPAVAAGLAAVFTFPLRHGEGRLGALDLYSDVTGELDDDDMRAAQTLADVAAAYVLNAQARETAQHTTEQFRESALHDALTGLPNRLLLQQRLEHAALRARRSRSIAAVLFADLDRFKRVNDTHGHAVGDELLVAVAERLSEVVRPGDTLARVSGDEFVFLCEDLAHLDDVERLAVRIVDAFVEPFALSGGLHLDVSASVGIAYCGQGEAVTHQMIANADTAMYQAKRRGGGVHQMIDLRAAKEERSRNRIEEALRAALVEGQLKVAYQPIVRTTDAVLVGVEALLRWTHPAEGMVPALTAVSVAEQSDLIDKVGSWVLEQACTDRMRWLGSHPTCPLDLSVNVSVRQLMTPGFAGTVAGVMRRTGIDPGALMLEVTEGIFIEDNDRAVCVLNELKALGVRLALDDFGTGFCSLGYLRRLPVDMVKIDQGFVADLGQHKSGAAIVTAVTVLAHGLGLGVIAEGVETTAQRDEIARIGCELAQGFLYADCMSSDQLCAAMAASGSRLRLPPDTDLRTRLGAGQPATR